MRFRSRHSPVVMALIFIAGLVTTLSLVASVTSGSHDIRSTPSIDPFALMQAAPRLVEQKMEGDLI